MDGELDIDDLARRYLDLWERQASRLNEEADLQSQFETWLATWQVHRRDEDV